MNGWDKPYLLPVDVVIGVAVRCSVLITKPSWPMINIWSRYLQRDSNPLRGARLALYQQSHLTLLPYIQLTYVRLRVIADPATVMLLWSARETSSKCPN